jgi:hypothetical protein
MSALLFISLLVFLAYTLTANPREKAGSKDRAGSGPAEGTDPRQRSAAGSGWFERGNTVTPIDRGNMIRCHQCGCFFSEARAVTRVVEGHILHFCTNNCRDNFRYP